MDRHTKGFIIASLLYFFAAAVLGILMGTSVQESEWIGFVHVHFNLLGFMAMMVYGVGYFILPRFNAKELKWPHLLPAHFYIANIGLIGLAFTAAERPSMGFTMFAIINVLSVAMFSLNIGLTLLSPEEEEEEEESAAPHQAPEPTIEIGPDTRMGEILTKWPELIPILVNNGFKPLSDPAHVEQVKQMPVTLGMACSRHDLDMEMIIDLLTQGAKSLAKAAPQPQNLQPLSAITKSGLAPGEPIKLKHIIGDILKVYPATEKVFRKHYGSACFSCPGQATESVTQSAMMHNVDKDQVLAELNKAAGM